MQTPSLTHNDTENTHKSEATAPGRRKGTGRTYMLRLVTASTPLLYLEPSRSELLHFFQPFPPGGFGGGGGFPVGSDAGEISGLVLSGFGFFVLSFFAIKFVFKCLNLS